LVLTFTELRGNQRALLGLLRGLPQEPLGLALELLRLEQEQRVPWFLRQCRNPDQELSQDLRRILRFLLGYICAHELICSHSQTVSQIVLQKPQHTWPSNHGHLQNWPAKEMQRQTL
jgi:hypothetical protein